ncbi:TPA: STM4504/CBY_0614 family protein [Pseudomonas aeruginosa]
MAIFDIYSKRQKKLRGEISDVYSYDEIPNKLRVQIIHIINNTIGECTAHYQMNNYPYKFTHSDSLYKEMCEILRREYGVFELHKNSNSYYTEIFDFFLNQDDIEKCIDIIELSFNAIDKIVREEQSNFYQEADEAIEELNHRFRENGVGYQFEQGEIIRVDSQLIHSEVVKPVLLILSGTSEYDGVLHEFMSAHEHYRNKKYKESLNDCLKSFESFMKAIHEKNNWNYNQNDTAKKLINSCLANNLIPEYLQNQFSSLRTLLESGVPTIRNKEGGHGQGTNITNVPEHLASYTLHLTATNLLFLAKCEELLK